MCPFHSIIYSNESLVSKQSRSPISDVTSERERERERERDTINIQPIGTIHTAILITASINKNTAIDESCRMKLSASRPFGSRTRILLINRPFESILTIHTIQQSSEISKSKPRDGLSLAQKSRREDRYTTYQDVEHEQYYHPIPGHHTRRSCSRSRP